MSKEADFMLGIAMGLLMQIRTHIIRVQDEVGLGIIEQEYQDLKTAIEKHYYGDMK
jgi:hypothetical protein